MGALFGIGAAHAGLQHIRLMVRARFNRATVVPISA
jgi:hypothetical protein